MTKSMYSRPSTSDRYAPVPRSTKNGAPPTRLNARTGEFTPPGISCCAASNRRALAEPVAAPVLADFVASVSTDLTNQIVFECVGDQHVYKLARLHVARVIDVHDTVDLEGLA